MELFTFLIGFLLIVSLVGIGRRFKSKHTVSNLPPCPWKLPLIGNLHQLFFDLPHRAMRDLAKKHGPIMHLQLGEVTHVVVSSPEIAKQVMKTHDAIFASRPHVMAIDILSYGATSIAFSPYGEYWRQLRRICNSELLNPKRVQSFRSIREEQTSNLIKWIACNEGKPINFTQKVYSMLFTTLSKAAFGKKNEDHESIRTIAIEMSNIAAGFNIVDFYPSVELFHSISRIKPTLENLHSRIDSLLEKIISDHKTDSAGVYVEHEDCKDLVDVLLRHQDESADFHLGNDNIKAVLLDMYTAGGETTGTTISWAMSEMMRNPSILRRAQEEVRHAFGNLGYVDEDKIDDLKFTTSVIKETLRLHPPIPLIPRQNIEKVEINGYEIPPKTKVIVNAWAINRDPSYWDDADCFRPERFLGRAIDYMGRDFGYIPFGAGKRICPGIAFGWVNVLLPMAHFLYYFDWELPNGMRHEDLSMAERFGSSVGRKDDLCIIPRIRNPLSFPC